MRTGTAISAAAVGVGARRSEAKSISVVSVSCPTAEISGMAEAAAALGCLAAEWRSGEPLAGVLAAAGLTRIAVPYLPTGWTRDTLAPDLAPLAAQGRVVLMLDDLNRAAWPRAKAGFFGVAKAIDSLLAECGIGGGA